VDGAGVSIVTLRLSLSDLQQIWRLTSGVRAGV
ncbi:MAG: hypothetical protein ACI91Q_002924, partial [Gammaproteobacteria bacterium]